MLKGYSSHTNIKIQANGLSSIQLRRVSEERVGGPPGVNISNGPGGVTSPVLKALASVDDISGSQVGGWRQFMGPRSLLGKVGRRLVV